MSIIDLKIEGRTAAAIIAWYEVTRTAGLGIEFQIVEYQKRLADMLGELARECSECIDVDTRVAS